MEDIKIMTRKQVRDFDGRVIDEFGLPGVVLMENAGRSCAEIITGHFEASDVEKVLIICGTGNNGGDGFVIARHLINFGTAVEVIIAGDDKKIGGDALVNYNVYKKIGPVSEFVDPYDESASDVISEIIVRQKCTLVVDAIFGTGLQGDLRGHYPGIFKAINDSGVKVVAVDIPSGLDCDTGRPLKDENGGEIAVEADVTVTFVALKKGFHDCAESVQYTGEIYIASIGIEPD